MSTTTNLWKRLKQLLPEPPLLIGVVVGTATYSTNVELPDGAVLNVRGTATMGATVFIRDGVIEGPAPDLLIELIEI